MIPCLWYTQPQDNPPPKKKLLVISGLTANWNIGTDSISLFNPVEAQREAPFSSSRPLISHICVSRQDQARPRPACLEGRRLNPPTCTLQFTLCLLLGKAVNMAWMPCSLLLPLFSLCLLLPWLLLSQHTACKQSSQASRLGWPLTSDFWHGEPCSWWGTDILHFYSFS